MKTKYFSFQEVMMVMLPNNLDNILTLDDKGIWRCKSVGPISDKTAGDIIKEFKLVELVNKTNMTSLYVFPDNVNMYLIDGMIEHARKPKPEEKNNNLKGEDIEEKLRRLSPTYPQVMTDDSIPLRLYFCTKVRLIREDGVYFKRFLIKAWQFTEEDDVEPIVFFARFVEEIYKHIVCGSFNESFDAIDIDQTGEDERIQKIGGN